MAEPGFHLPRGAILFSDGGVAYEFRTADEVARELRSGLGTTTYRGSQAAAELQTFAVAGRERLKELTSHE